MLIEVCGKGRAGAVTKGVADFCLFRVSSNCNQAAKGSQRAEPIFCWLYIVQVCISSGIFQFLFVTVTMPEIINIFLQYK